MYRLIRKILRFIAKPIRAICNKVLMNRWKKYSDLYYDQISVETLKARAQYVPFERFLEFSDRIWEIQEGNKTWHLVGNINDVKQLVIYGKGKWYEYTRQLLQRSDFEGNYRFIGDKEELLGNIGSEESVLVAYGREKYERMAKRIKKKYPDINVLDKDIIYAHIGNQYFDIFSPEKGEVIVDAGACDGRTEKQFFEWGKENIETIYAFELDPGNKVKCLDLYKKNGYHNVVFINKGVGNENKTIHLAEGNENSPSSKVGKGSREVPICRIDDEITGKVTFIKMDIEGEELNALRGAERTIREYKPHLAICIYHKASDLYKIPGYLHEIVPEYKFVVRHYTSIDWETVLYAWV